MAALSPEAQQLFELATIYRSRIGVSRGDQLRWLLKFAFAELDKLLPEEKSILDLELRALTLGTVGEMHADPERKSQHPPTVSLNIPAVPMDETEFRKLHEEINTGLKNLLTADGGKSEAWKIPPPRALGVSRRHPDIKARMRFYTDTDFSDQSIRIVILNAVRQVLLNGQGMIRACKECGKPFVPRRRQEYDTPACSQRVRDRKRSPQKSKKKSKTVKKK